MLKVLVVDFIPHFAIEIMTKYYLLPVQMFLKANAL